MYHPTQTQSCKLNFLQLLMVPVEHQAAIMVHTYAKYFPNR